MTTEEHKKELCDLLRELSKQAVQVEFIADTRRGIILDLEMDFREVRKHAEITRIASSGLRQSLQKLDDWLYKTEEQSDNY